MTEIKLTKRYPQSRTEDIIDAYMRGWNDALDAVQNGKFIINDDRKTESNSEKPNNSTISKMEQVKQRSCDTCKGKDVEGWKNPCLGCTEFTFYEPKDEPQTCSVNGRPYSECSSCEHFRCTADEPQTERSE